MDGIEKKIGEEFEKRLESISSWLDNFEEEDYNWRNIKKELAISYGSLPERLQNKYKEMYWVEVDLINMVIEQNKEKRA